MKSKTPRILWVGIVASLILVLTIVADYLGESYFNGQCSISEQWCMFLVFNVGFITSWIAILFSLYVMIMLVYVFAKKVKRLYSFVVIATILSITGFVFSNGYFKWVSLACYLALFLISLFNIWKE
ncbi:hypothetical protein COV16_04205 [Candidatus Woesearchaeota archaeon CG10_big_fil_rev_8_21_14_0_10_34_8]|nr:MAG: hypothetical protein COV16_04205 [Candidatus Woesearchaeota archaeon CG10_big_fil_rev_8_21_14_0_10_34_8]